MLEKQGTQPDIGWAEAETLLGQDPEFGDGESIERRALARVRVGLSLLAAVTPDEAGALAAASVSPDVDLLELMRDPLLRNAFETDLTALGRSDSDQSWSAAQLLAQTKSYTASRLACAARPVQSAERTLWLWTDSGSSPDDLMTCRLRQMLDAMFPTNSVGVLVSASDEQLDMVTPAAELLRTVLPTVGPSVLRHVGMVVLAREEAADDALLSAAGGDGSPATVILSTENFGNVWDVAGALLHEGSHLLLFEIIRCGAMIREQVDPEAPTVPIPWRLEDWSLVRTVFALHVYVHLTLFHQAVACMDPRLRKQFGEPPQDAGMSESSLDDGGFSSAARAAHLAEQLRSRSDLLTDYGNEFVSWLTRALDLLTDTDPDSAATYHAVTPAASVALPDQDRLVLAISDQPALRWLNLSSWLIYSLCDGRDKNAICADYVAAVADIVPSAEAEQHVLSALVELVDQNVVQRR